MTAIRPVTAHQWSCPDCHDTGLERTEAAASEALQDHVADYHA